MSLLGHKQKSGDAIATSDLPLKADLADQARHVGFVRTAEVDKLFRKKGRDAKGGISL
jgi:hypothetical protein